MRADRVTWFLCSVRGDRAIRIELWPLVLFSMIYTKTADKELLGPIDRTGRLGLLCSMRGDRAIKSEVMANQKRDRGG